MLLRKSATPFVLSSWLLGMMAMSALATAQQADSGTASQLEPMRLDFQRRLLEASLEPLKQHLANLTTLEKERAEARDYSGAIEARDLRQRWEDDLERLDKEWQRLQMREQWIDRRLSDRIALPLDAAQLSGVSRQGGLLTRWSKPGATATWKLPNLPPGGYEVILRYRCGALEGGRIQVQESRYTLEANIETTLRGPQSRTIGTLKITDGKGTLTLRALSVVKDNLMALQAVELIPISR